MTIKDIDISFDYQTDTRKGKDPDSDSKTLRAYQQLLWSKPLPFLSDGKDTTFLQTGKRFVGKMEADVENSRKRFWGTFSTGGFALFWEGSIFNYLFGQPV